MTRCRITDSHLSYLCPSDATVKNLEQLFLEPEWAIVSEAMRARGIIALVKSN